MNKRPFPGPHISGPAMYGQVADSSIDDPFDELERILLVRKKPNFRGHGDFGGHCFAKGGENGAKEIGVREESSAHSRMS